MCRGEEQGDSKVKSKIWKSYTLSLEYELRAVILLGNARNTGRKLRTINSVSNALNLKCY